jgi:hypothetical protein
MGESHPYRAQLEEYRASDGVKVLDPIRDERGRAFRDGRRHEYTVDILGGDRGLNYALGYRNVDGIMVPTTRRVYPSDANKQKVPKPVLVAIDMRNISFS